MSLPIMQWLDYLIIIMMFASMLLGLLKGLIRSATSLASWILAVLMGMAYSHQLGQYFTGFIAAPTICNIVAFAVIFIITLFVGGIAGRLIAAIFRSVGLSGIDRVLGLVFGYMRGVIIVGVFLVIMGYTSISSTSAWTDSVLRPYWDPVVELIQSWVQGSGVTNLDPSNLNPANMIPKSA